jgi:hypothetical protein
MFVVVAEVVYAQEIDSIRLFTEPLGELVLIGCAGKNRRPALEGFHNCLENIKGRFSSSFLKVTRDQQLEKNHGSIEGLPGLP